ncbi:MAG: metallophosphatase domain-containing protein [Burkholderiales bacterium]
MSIRFVCVSDTHSKLDKVAIPDGDVLVHTGDLSRVGAVNDLAEQFKLLNKMPHEHIVAIAGNHDHGLQHIPDLAKLYGRRYPRVRYLDSTSAEVAGVKLWGSPWTPWFLDWAFNFPRGDAGEQEATLHYAGIPDDTQLLITHGPPRGVLDQLDERGSEPFAHVGSIALRKRIDSLPRLRAHVFWHIHSQYGTQRDGNVLFVNAATCTEQYQPTNPPIVLDWDGRHFEVIAGGSR